MGNVLFSGIGRGTTVQISHMQDDLLGTVTVLLEDGMGVTLHIAKYDKHDSEILL